MRGFLLDTHIWFWFLDGSPRLPVGLRNRIERESHDCWLSPISLWETGLLVSRGKVKIPHPLRRWVTEALEKFPLNEAFLNNEVALLSREVALEYQDPADRFIAATTLVYDLVLMTVDERLTNLKWLPTRSR